MTHEFLDVNPNCNLGVDIVRFLFEEDILARCFYIMDSLPDSMKDNVEIIACARGLRIRPEFVHQYIAAVHSFVVEQQVGKQELCFMRAPGGKAGVVGNNAKVSEEMNSKFSFHSRRIGANISALCVSMSAGKKLQTVGDYSTCDYSCLRRDGSSASSEPDVLRNAKKNVEKPSCCHDDMFESWNVVASAAAHGRTLAAVS